jgi:hypothetical protein
VATVALWHLGLTAVLAAVLLTVMVVQSLSDAVERLRRRRRASGTVSVPLQVRPTVEPRLVSADGSPAAESVPTMASAAVAH